MKRAFFIAGLLLSALFQSQQPLAADTSATSAVSATAAISASGLRLPAVFGNHMVLQRDTIIPVWGWATAGETVKVTAGSAAASAKADGSGKWLVKLAKLPASAAPITVTVTAPSKTITFTDVLVGDVWLCSGQSNMALPLSGASNATEELAQANHPTLRLFKPKTQAAIQPRPDCSGQWQLCTPDTAKGITAVGYFFAKDITESQKIPVGLIDTSVGSTPCQSWTSLAALKSDPDLEKFYVAPVAALIADPVAAKAAHDKWLAAGGAEFQAAMRKYYQDYYLATKNGQPISSIAHPKPPATPEPPYFDNAVVFPTVLYNGTISPLAPFALKGALWYQGEGNASAAALYGKLLTAMIHCWRDLWQQGDFPFYIVQLPNIGARATQPEQAIGGWPLIREQMRLIAKKVPNTGLAVAIDLGEKSLHPPFKCEVGRRLALAVRQDVYGEKIVGHSPVPESWKIDGDKVVIKFVNVGTGLKIGAPPKGSLTAPPATDVIKGFSIAGSDHKFVWATARIEGQDTVVVSSSAVQTPVVVRYGWASYPEVNLYNSGDLPASPFSIEPPPAPTPAAGIISPK